MYLTNVEEYIFISLHRFVFYICAYFSNNNKRMNTCELSTQIKSSNITNSKERKKEQVEGL